MVPTTLTRDEVIYYAGLFDGEGCIYIGKGPTAQPWKYQLLVHITNSYRPVIDRLKDRYGGHLQTQGKNRPHEIYTLHLRSLKAQEFLKNLLPFLQIKKAEAELALEFQRHMSTSQRPVGEEELDEREQFRLGLKQLREGARTKGRRQ